MYVTKRKTQEGPLSVLADELLAEIGQCVQSAIECDIPQIRTNLNSMIRNTQSVGGWNALGQFGWNYIAARLLNNGRLKAVPTKRGGWNMVFIHDEDSDFLITLMREKRFEELQAEQPQRRRMHYIDVLSKSLNADLQMVYPQMEFFPKEFVDEDSLEAQFKMLLRQLDSDVALLSRFAIMLFDTERDHVSNLRIVLVDADLNIVDEKKLNSLLTFDVAPVVETASELGTPAQNPDRNLKLKKNIQTKKTTNIQRKNLTVRSKSPKE